jgi:hypothetical protein
MDLALVDTVMETIVLVVKMLVVDMEDDMDI